MDKERIPEEIFELLASKNYEELTEQEKQMVDQYIGADVYESYGALVFDFKQEDKSLEGKLTELPFIAKKESFLSRIANYTIPLYQVAAIFAILISTFLLWQKKDIKVVSIPNDSKEILKEGTTIDKDYYPENLVFNL